MEKLFYRSVEYKYRYYVKLVMMDPYFYLSYPTH